MPRHISQVTLKRNSEDPVSEDFFRFIEFRDREMYPTIFSYLNAAVEALEVQADGGGNCRILGEADLERIELTVLGALRAYEKQKREEQMIP